MGMFRETLKNASMEEKKKLAIQATLLGMDLGWTIDFLDLISDIHMDLLRRNLEVTGLELVDGDYKEIRIQEDILVKDKDMKIYKKDPEE